MNASSPRLSDAGFWAASAALLAGVRLCHVNVLWVDEAYGMAAARRLLEGAALYRDLWFDKPPLYAWIYLLWDAQAGWPLRLGGALFALLCCWLAGRTATALFGPREGRYAAVLMVFFLAFDHPVALLSLGPDLLLIPFALGAVWALAANRSMLAAACAAAGLVANAKAILLLPLILFWQPRDWKRILPVYTIAFAAVWLSASGWLEPVWEWGRLYAADSPVAHPFAEGLLRTANWAGFHAALVIGAAIYFGSRSHSPVRPRAVGLPRSPAPLALVAQTLVSAAPRLISAWLAGGPNRPTISARGVPQNPVETSLDPADTSVRATDRNEKPAGAHVQQGGAGGSACRAAEGGLPAAWQAEQPTHSDPEPDRRWPMAAWLALSLVMVAAGARFFPRYYFALLPVLVVAAARGVCLIPGRWRAALLVLTLAVPAVRFGARHLAILRADPVAMRDLALWADCRDAAIQIRLLARPGDTLFVWGYRPELNVLAGLPGGTPFLDSQPLTGVIADRHLTNSQPTAPILAAHNRLRLVETKPTFIADGLGPYNSSLAIVSFGDLQAWFAQYDLVAETTGTRIYRLR